MFKFDFNKEYVFSYLFYEKDMKQRNKKYHKLSGKKIDIISQDLGYINYKGINYFIKPQWCLELKIKE